MNILTITQSEPQSHETHFQPLPNGDIEVCGRLIRKYEGGKTAKDDFASQETRLAIIPKSQRAAVAHFLVTGEVMP